MPSAPPASRTARKPHRCGRCLGQIKPGQRYAAYAITPKHPDFGNAKWLRGRQHLKATGCYPGAAAIAADLIAEPHRFKVLLMIVDCKRVTSDIDTGEQVPTARVRRVEPVLPQDLAAAEQLMRRALEHRTGRVTLPLSLEDEMRIAFRDIDPDTGEKRGDGPRDG